MTIVIPDAASLGVFAAAAIALLLTPGPAVLYIVARSVEQGRVAGLASVCGIFTGTLAHVLAATLGLSALLASSALAFAAVKYAGAAYLVYLGARRILAPSAAPAAQRNLPRRALSRLYRDGFVVNLLNPEWIVLSGGLSRAGRFLLDPLRRTIQKRSFPAPAGAVKLVISRLDQDLGIVGAGLLAHEKFDC